MSTTEARFNTVAKGLLDVFGFVWISLDRVSHLSPAACLRILVCRVACGFLGQLGIKFMHINTTSEQVIDWQLGSLFIWDCSLGIAVASRSIARCRDASRLLRVSTLEGKTHLCDLAGVAVRRHEPCVQTTDGFAERRTMLAVWV